MGRGRGVAAPPLRLEGVMTPELHLLLLGGGRGVAAPLVRLEGVITPELYLLLLAVNVVFLAVNVVFQRLRFPRRPT